jgi:hypothetical protein
MSDESLILMERGVKALEKIGEELMAIHKELRDGIKVFQPR